jgi:hypothetical protein
MEFIHKQLIVHPQVDHKGAGQASGETNQVDEKSSFESLEGAIDEE